MGMGITTHDARRREEKRKGRIGEGEKRRIRN
jgi:hypothetical protein